jgi:alpha-galactosidase
MNNRATSPRISFPLVDAGEPGNRANLNKRTPEDFATAKKLVAEYKSIRATVQDGVLYRLISPLEGSEYSVTESVARDGHEAVVFAFLHSSQQGRHYPKL